jgi:hypothetical protein
VHHPTISRAVATARTQDLLAAAGERAPRTRSSRSTKARRGVAALAVAIVAALAVGTGAAHAQPLHSVTISTDASLEYLVLDVSGGSTRPGAEIIQWAAHSGANQRWNFVDMGDGTQEIVNQNSNMCLTTDGRAGDTVYQWYCSGAPGQRWKGDIPRSWTTKRGGTLRNPWSGLALDVYGASPWPGAKIDAWYPNDASNQDFYFNQLY